MSEPNDNYEEWVREYVTELLGSQGITVEALESPYGSSLLEPETGGVLNLDNITAMTVRLDEGREETLATWVGQYLLFRSGQREEPTEAEIRAGLRTRLVPEYGAPDYAVEVASGISLVLCMNTEVAVMTFDDVSASELPFPPEEAFEIAQQNTNAEPIEGVFEVEPGIWALGSDSFFVAGKVASFETLLSTIGSAPHGVAFCPIARNSIVYTVLEDDERAYTTDEHRAAGYILGRR